ncbi:DUF5320 domain-containing protein [Sinanaerobacter sp. ZZT-01]|uniref:DUF5320 domain-containing protein n=1 Tax=Sinanaerobacter sp. ZZT-01 TaxID=3111540 RepID=UPI002D77BE3A|nr:DUF5320 domain-containing protein [Sinanaerobacter sp. ZZT-01]WRR92487.1 DUF5320 domain-containing protein [Sinanaerobacter sp. ZZT-01]
MPKRDGTGPFGTGVTCSVMPGSGCRIGMGIRRKYGNGIGRGFGCAFGSGRGFGLNQDLKEGERQKFQGGKIFLQNHLKTIEKRLKD